MTGEPTPDQEVAMAEMAGTILHVCLKHPVTASGVPRAGSLVWVDPTTTKERVTAPNEPLYSTALMLAEFIIGPNGERLPFLESIDENPAR